MTNEEVIFEILTLIVITVSAFFVWLSIHRANHWNRKKGSQEILNQFVIGDIPDLNKTLKINFKCKVYDHSVNYSKFVKKLKKDQKAEFDDTLLRMLNIFEVIGINIKNKIIKEQICWDYVGWFYTEYYRFSIDLLKERRKAANDIRVLENFEKYALKWMKKMKS